ncbi:hypothetical protein F4802DRAFT_596982 [Xylaria palmicola]|nr:hypothetical protein F4802DRAFT_596982 [Xylaria palmicola]
MSKAYLLAKEKYQAVLDDAGRGDYYLEHREVTELALARWRHLSAFLLRPNKGEHTALVPSKNVSTQGVQELTLALNRFPEPFISRDREARHEQENDLREIIAEHATFGYILLSQPSDYRFRFDNRGTLDTIVVFPGLDKLIGKKGCRYRPLLPRIIAPVVESI